MASILYIDYKETDDESHTDGNRFDHGANTGSN
jgi:hypothetical protein